MNDFPIKKGTFVLSLCSTIENFDFYKSHLGIVASCRSGFHEVVFKTGTLTLIGDMLVPLFEVEEDDLRTLSWQQVFDKYYLQIINSLAIKLIDLNTLCDQFCLIAE